MSKKAGKFTSETKFFGIPIFTIVQTSYEISSKSDSSSVTDEMILHERINLLKEKEQKKRR